MKKLLALLLVLAIVLGCSGCTLNQMLSYGEDTTPSTSYTPSSTPTPSYGGSSGGSGSSSGDQHISLSMFKKFGVIGDSYASGAIYTLDEAGNPQSAGIHYDLSWGQVMARNLGTTCTNFSTGGLTTKSWLTDARGLPLLLSTAPQDIYYLMLGINDKGYYGVDGIGTIDDIKEDYTQNADSFYGNYGKIISSVMAYAPNAKLIISTMVGVTDTNKAFNDAIEQIAAHFGIPCVKQYESAFFNGDFYLNNMVGGHPTAPVYAAMATELQAMFEKAVWDNVAYFQDYVG